MKMDTRKKATLWGVIAGVTLTVIILAAVGLMLISGGKDANVTISESTLKIDSMFGLTVPLEDITGVTLLEQSMEQIEPDGSRVMGYGGIGSALKGQFSSEGLGKYLLFVDSTAAPTLLIERAEGQSIYISYQESEKTRALYDALQAALKKE